MNLTHQSLLILLVWLCGCVVGRYRVSFVSNRPSDKRVSSYLPTTEYYLLLQVAEARPGARVCYVRVEINGWIGSGENFHGCCMISTGDEVGTCTRYYQRWYYLGE